MPTVTAKDRQPETETDRQTESLVINHHTSCLILVIVCPYDFSLSSSLCSFFVNLHFLSVCLLSLYCPKSLIFSCVYLSLLLFLSFSSFSFSFSFFIITASPYFFSIIIFFISSFSHFSIIITFPLFQLLLILLFLHFYFITVLHLYYSVLKSPLPLFPFFLFHFLFVLEAPVGRLGQVRSRSPFISSPSPHFSSLPRHKSFLSRPPPFILLPLPRPFLSSLFPYFFQVSSSSVPTFP